MRKLFYLRQTLQAAFLPPFFRVLGMFYGSWVLLGCNFFTTQTLVEPPKQINQFANNFTAGQKLEYRIKASVKTDTGTVQRLPLQRVVFTALRDSLIDGFVYKQVTFIVITSQESDTVYQEKIWLNFGLNGTWSFLNKSSDSNSMMQYFAFKRLAQIVAQGDSETVFQPSLGLQWTINNGAFQIHREIIALDTLPYHHHAEVAWKIKESVKIGDQLLSTGFYWIGQSGLLKSEQSILNFVGYSNEGNVSGQGFLLREIELL